MRAIGFHRPLPITSDAALVDLHLPQPVATGHDILVRIEAVSVNPVDTKVRANFMPLAGDARILGYDAAGVVTAVGTDVTLFKPGDEVYYAGAINRPGTNAEYHLVDERIVALKPKTLSFAEAAALPLTAITAYEALFHRIRVQEPVCRRRAGDPHYRRRRRRWVDRHSACKAVDESDRHCHRFPTRNGELGTVSRCRSRDRPQQASCGGICSIGDRRTGLHLLVTHSTQHRLALAEIIAPAGRICLIDDFADGFDIMAFKPKAVSLHWEMMFSRPMFQTTDMIEQHRLLTHVADLIDAGKVRTTLDAILGQITAKNLREAHRIIESERARGKIVLEGFPV